jgi:hypothetical protein
MDEDNWRSLGEVLADVTERALMKAMVGQSGTEAWRQPLYALPPPQQTEGSTVRVGIRKPGANTPPAVLTREEPTSARKGSRQRVPLLVIASRCEPIAIAPTRLPPPRAMGSHLVVIDPHLPRSLYLIRSTTQASAISASVPRS